MTDQAPVLATDIHETMIDHNNGTYTYEFTPVGSGPLNIAVFTFDDSGDSIYVEYYDELEFGGDVVLTEYWSTINIFWGEGLVTPTKSDEVSLYFSFYIKPPATTNYTFEVGMDDGATLILDDEVLIDYFDRRGSFTKYAEKDLDSDEFYHMVIMYNEDAAAAKLFLWWHYLTIEQEVIPANSTYQKVFVADSPYDAYVECPALYTAENPDHLGS